MKRLKHDNGEANTIEMIFIMLLLFAILITIIDAGLYFNNRYVVSNAAQNGARVAAVFGGVNENAISKKYGVTKVSPECKNFGANSVVACSVYEELKESTQSVNAQVKSIECGPGKTSKVGERTYCEINYTYKGIPGSAMSISTFFGDSKVRMTAETEVIHK